MTRPVAEPHSIVGYVKHLRRMILCWGFIAAAAVAGQVTGSAIREYMDSPAGCVWTQTWTQLACDWDTTWSREGER